MRRRLDQQRVAIRLRFGHHLSTDQAARARSIFDHHGLMPGLGQEFRDDAPRNVGA
jgi:hypothetical protein